MDIQKENSIFDNLNKKNINEFLNIDIHSEIIAKTMLEKIISLTITEINISEIDKQTIGFCSNLFFNTCNQLLMSEYICHEYDDIKNKDHDTLKNDISELSFLNEVYLEENIRKNNNNLNNHLINDLSPNIRKKNTLNDDSSSINLNLNDNLEYDCLRQKKNKWDILKCPIPSKADFYSGSRMKFIQAKSQPVVHYTTSDGKEKIEIKSKFNKFGRRMDNKSTVSLNKIKNSNNNFDKNDNKYNADNDNLNSNQDNKHNSGGSNIIINNGSNDFNNNNNIISNNNSSLSKIKDRENNINNDQNQNNDSPTITLRNRGNKGPNYKFVKYEILEVQENKENPEIIKIREEIKEKDNKLSEEERLFKEKNHRGLNYQKNDRNDNKEKPKEIDGKKMTFDSNGAVILIKSLPIERLPNDFVSPKIEVNEMKDERAAIEILSQVANDPKLLFQINEYVKAKNYSSLSSFLIKCKFDIGIDESSYDNVSKIIINTNPNGLPNTENLKANSTMVTSNLTNIKKKQPEQQVIVLGKTNLPEKKEKKIDKVIQPAGSNFE